MYRKIMSLLICFLLLFSLVACGEEKTGITDKSTLSKTVLEVGDYDITVSEAQLRFYIQYRSFLNDNYYYLTNVGLDKDKLLSEQSCYYDSSITWAEYFVNSAFNDLIEIYAVRTAMDNDASFTLDENEVNEELEAFGSRVSLYAEYLGMTEEEYVSYYYGYRMTVDELMNYMKLNLEATQYHDMIVDGIEVTDDEMSSYYRRNAGLASYNYNGCTVYQVYIEYDDSISDTEEKEAEAYSRMQVVLDEWNSGEKTEERISELAVKYSQQSSAKSTGGKYTMFDKSSFITNISNWIFDSSRQAGDYDVIKSEYGYHLFYYAATEELLWKYYARSGVQSEKYSTWLDNYLSENCTVEYDEELVDILYNFY